MNNPVVLGIYGTSNTGKTTLIVDLVSWLTGQGFLVATIKKTDQPYQMDMPEKDTFFHGKAGAIPVVFSSPIETTFILKKSLSEPDIIKNICSIIYPDVIFIEGCSHPAFPKIQMDNKSKKRDNTLFVYQNSQESIRNYIHHELQERKKSMRYSTTLIVNGKNIPLSEFPNEFIQKTLIGMISSLKGVDNIQSVHLSLESQ